MNQALATLPLSPELGIQIQDVSASWSDKGTVTLRNINLSVPKGKLCAIIGSVGSGKVGIVSNTF